MCILSRPPLRAAAPVLLLLILPALLASAASATNDGVGDVSARRRTRTLTATNLELNAAGAGIELNAAGVVDGHGASRRREERRISSNVFRHPTKSALRRERERLAAERKRLRAERRRKRRERQRLRKERERLRKERLAYKRAKRQPARPSTEVVTYAEPVEVYDTVEITFRVVCGDRPDGSLTAYAKARLERALLRHFRETADCDVDTDEEYAFVNIVAFAESQTCLEDLEENERGNRKRTRNKQGGARYLQQSSSANLKRRRRLSLAKMHRRYRCMKCRFPTGGEDRRMLLRGRAEEVESILEVFPPEPEGGASVGGPLLAGGYGAEAESELLAASPSSSSEDDGRQQPRRSLQRRCEAIDLVPALNEEDFDEAEEANVTSINTHDCTQPRNCNAQDGRCCGFDRPGGAGGKCECGDTVSESLCVAEGCFLEGVNPDACCARDPGVPGAFLYDGCSSTCGCLEEGFVVRKDDDDGGKFARTVAVGVGGFCSDSPDGTLTPAETAELEDTLLRYAARKVEGGACADECISYTDAAVLSFEEAEGCRDPTSDGAGSFVRLEVEGTCCGTLCVNEQFP